MYNTKKWTVYKSTNVINHKFYIGVHKTNDPEDPYLGSGTYLLRAVRKYGRENFKKEILGIFNQREQAYAFEGQLVTPELIESGMSYNIALGGVIGEDNSHRAVAAMRRKRQDPLFLEYCSRRISEGLARPGVQDRIRKTNEVNGYENKPFLGRQHTKDTKKVMSEKASVLRKGAGNTNYGKCWIVRNGFEKSIRVAELEIYLQDGWVRGRRKDSLPSVCRGADQPSKNCCYVTKNGISIRVTRSDFQNYIEEGWIKGRNTIGTPWVTKGNMTKRVKEEDLPTYLEQGWQKGRKSTKSS
jgi:hypothetical protein